MAQWRNYFYSSSYSSALFPAQFQICSVPSPPPVKFPLTPFSVAEIWLMDRKVEDKCMECILNLDRLSTIP